MSGILAELPKKVISLAGRRKLFDSVVDAPGYYPDLQRKSRSERRRDLKRWHKKYHELNYRYNLYGFDVAGMDSMDDYLDYGSFVRMRDSANLKGLNISQIPLLQDKFLFFRFMKSVGLPTPEVFAFISDGKFYDMNMTQISRETLIGKKDYFLKDVSGLGGNDVKHIKDYETLSELIPVLSSGNFILQEAVRQCDELNTLYAGSLNTLRIVTAKTPDGIIVFSKVMRIGSSKSGKVDNFDSGGIAVGVLDNGYLKETGKTKQKFEFGGTVTQHPDTGVVFKTFKIPMFEEACELAGKAHSYFYNMNTVGWDIAFTDNGLTIIEGNDNWDGAFLQANDRPIRKEFSEITGYVLNRRK